MAKAGKKVVERLKFTALHKLTAGVSLLAFVVTLAAGLMAEARITTIVYRSVVVIVAIGMLSRIVVRIWSYYEEIHRGQT